MDSLARIDVNLLVVLNALLEEQHVTRAGQKVGLTQPATSNALNRLRRMFEDPLLQRVGSRMELTPRGAALREPVAQGLNAIRSVFQTEDEFDPATAKGFIRLSTTDAVLLVLLPKVIERIAAEAPGIDLDVTQFGILDDVEMLMRDELDLVIGLVDSIPPRVRVEHLLHDEVVCMVRDDHPTLGDTGVNDRLPLEGFLNFPHLRVAPRATHRGAVSSALGHRRLERRVACQVPDFLAAPFLVVHSDLITVLSSRVAEQFTEMLPLTTRRPPFDLDGFDTEMLWHARSDEMPLLQWLRSIISEEAGRLRERSDESQDAVIPASTGNVTPVT